MWYECWSESKQKPYFVNTKTKESSWAVPISFVSTQQGYDEIAQLSNREEVMKNTEAIRKVSNAEKRKIIDAGIAALDETYGSEKYNVLDVACGKGGDLWKYRDTRRVMRYVGIDSSKFSIEEAKERAKKVDGLNTQFEILDARRNIAWEEAFGNPFHMISIQFALHYLFSSEKTARKFFERAYRATTEKGVMLATFPSADIVLAILGGQRRSPKYMRLEAAEGIRLTSGRPIPYIYSLEGSVKSIPEFTIPFESLEKVCEETGWIPKHVATFNDLYHSYLFVKV